MDKVDVTVDDKFFLPVYRGRIAELEQEVLGLRDQLMNANAALNQYVTKEHEASLPPES